ncbi:ABC transporter substrate-binding protein [Neptuniibacter halophilus]|uniref:ABC transporter substrate-binding protein n=1 Tax=Neptuniibacter halophilus TaxID=651666 RepID=UPI00257461D9|nr:extracellular solute-binding protein [Neptuniibacter halophilus]
MKSKKNLFAVSLLSASIGLASMPAMANQSKLTIVTSFPQDLTQVFEDAFEKANPDIDLEVLKKKTSSGIKYIKETASKNQTDLFWASAPDAFEVLKDSSLLQQYEVKASSIPEKIGSFPIHDPEGFYKGFAAAGYGIMWNTRYLKAKKLPAPTGWDDLKKPTYFGHVGMSAPSRSGTTHLTVETILQAEGWDNGWAMLKQMSGNFKSVTERSFGVPDGVNSGNFGLGIVIDFFGLSSQGAGFPVEFIYPQGTALVPANIGIISNAPNRAGAERFIDFLLSDQGQELLLDPKIRRLPVNPEIYAKAPQGFPNPFKDDALKSALHFDLNLSKNRYNLVNSMFDVMITYRMDDLRAATGAIHEAETALAEKPDAEAQALLEQAKALVAKLPISEAEANDPDFAAVFTQKRKKASDNVNGRQAEVEAQWDSFVVANYQQAQSLAEKALSML